MWILMLFLCLSGAFPKNDQTIPYLWSCGINMQVSQRDHLDSLGDFFHAFFFGKPSSSTDREDVSHFSQNTASMWWFQIYFYFHPYLGKIPILTNVSDGLVQPPTRQAFLSNSNPWMFVAGFFLLNKTELQKKTPRNILQDELFCLAISFLLVQAKWAIYGMEKQHLLWIDKRPFKDGQTAF